MKTLAMFKKYMKTTRNMKLQKRNTNLTQGNTDSKNLEVGSSAVEE